MPEGHTCPVLLRGARQVGSSPIHFTRWRHARKRFGDCTTSFGEDLRRQNHMICNLKFWKNIGLSMILMGGTYILTDSAQARTSPSRNDIFSAQKRLRAKGYYRGPID